MDALKKTLVLAAALILLGAAPSAAPTRVISIVPAVTEMLYAIGAGPQVIGVSSFDHYPAEVEKLARVGGLIDPDIERVISLRPDLVIVYGSQKDLIDKLDRAHIPMFNYRHSGLADITTTIRTLGERVGHAREAEAVASNIEKGLNDIRTGTAGGPRYKTLLVFGREPGSLRGIYASAGKGFLTDLLDVAGGADVFADVQKENIQVSSEQLITRAPEAVVELHGTLTADRRAAERRVWDQLPGLPAVKQNRIYLLAGDVLTIPGPRVVEAARMMAEALHPSAKK